MKVLIEVTKLRDWYTIYMDGEVYHEGHNIPYQIILEMLGVDYEVKEVEDW